jgi:hypothetical protein
MRAARYRLRFFTGATLTSATYGGGLYGDDTYGMEASDSLTTAHHRLVPWPAGSPTGPSWRYRQNDTEPQLEAQIIADDGVVNYTGLDRAVLVLTPVDNPTMSRTYDMAVITAPNGDQRLRRTWVAGDLSQPGAFRVAVVLIYSSNRRLTVPTNDQHTMIVTPDGTSTDTWDAAYWDAAEWS